MENNLPLCLQGFLDKLGQGIHNQPAFSCIQAKIRQPEAKVQRQFLPTHIWSPPVGGKAFADAFKIDHLPLDGRSHHTLWLLRLNRHPGWFLGLGFRLVKDFQHLQDVLLDFLALRVYLGFSHKWILDLPIIGG